MLLKSWARGLLRRRNGVILLALISTFAGVALFIDRPKGTILELLALPLLLAGGAAFAWVVWPRQVGAKAGPSPMAGQLLHRLSLEGRLVPFFPVLGVGVVLADLGYNLALSATPAIQTEDTIVLLGAAALIGYRFAPTRFARERDFVLTFFFCLNVILVVPLLIARAYYADFERSVDGYSWVALAPQTGALLRLVGVSNTVHAVAGSTAPGLTFMPQRTPIEVTVVITTACSGIYSFGIFASAFVAFVFTEFDQMSRRLWLLLALGLTTAYIANVLRMVVIVLVGYYTDSDETALQNMLLAHSYLGWLIFIAWIALFWGVLLRLIRPDEESTADGSRLAESRPRELSCQSCGRPLSPALPALRCECGSYHHKACLRGRECPQCGRLQPTEAILDGSAT